MRVRATGASVVRRWPLMCGVVLLGLAGVVFSGCSSELDPTEPEDAYLVFRNALFEGNEEAVWGRLDPGTKEFFETSYNELIEMDAEIEKYLPQADHRLARRQSGAILLRDVKDGKGLFLHLMTLDKFEHDDAIELGSRVDTVAVSEDQKSSKVTTRGGQEFYMTKGKNGQWYVMFYKSSEELQKSMAWVEANKVALRQTVDDLIAEEQKKREEIVAELIKK